MKKKAIEQTIKDKKSSSKKQSLKESPLKKSIYKNPIFKKKKIEHNVETIIKLSERIKEIINEKSTQDEPSLHELYEQWRVLSYEIVNRIESNNDDFGREIYNDVYRGIGKTPC